MHYTLKQLKYLDAAARHRSITGAAEEFSISPSSIAAAINAMEEQVSGALFVRHPSKGVTPTQYGQDFLAHVRGILEQHNQFEKSLGGVSSRLEGRVRLGCFAPLAPILLPIVMKTISIRYPTVSVEIAEGDTMEIIGMIANGELDLAMGYDYASAKNTKFSPLFDAPPHVALNAEHQLATRSVLDLEELRDEPMVLLNLQPTRDYMFGLFEERGLTPVIAHSSKSSELVRALVASGLGFSIFNVRPLRKQTYVVGDIVRIPLRPGYQTPCFGFIYRDEKNLTRVEKALIKTCEELNLDGVFKRVLVQ
ncbi:LysR family transcriptional regulator [Hoeflea sp. TYP-13]|uniref:LysR family transcriptional regulator n=1 Tax=Hoeflea sp. TYP-13 TaxID=3230023 RepID=UPI0034C5B9B5